MFKLKDIDKNIKNLNDELRYGLLVILNNNSVHLEIHPRASANVLNKSIFPDRIMYNS